mgnify:CR=1 FL=1
MPRNAHSIQRPRFGRPERRNALSWAVIEGLRERVAEARADPDVVGPVAVLDGAVGPLHLKEAVALDREPLGKALDIEGFIAPKSRRSSRLIVHITEYASSER